MNAGTITGNKILRVSGLNIMYGGGVHIAATSGSSFTMKGGTISKNYSATYGGGVCVSNANFIKTGGTIYGNDGGANANTAYTGGDAVYLRVVGTGGITRIRNTNAGTGINLDPSVAGPSGGWEN